MGVGLGRGSGRWVKLWLSGRCWARGTLLTMYSLGEAQRVLSTRGGGSVARGTCMVQKSGDRQGSEGRTPNPRRLGCAGRLHQGTGRFGQYLGKERTGRAGGARRIGGRRWGRQ